MNSKYVIKQLTQDAKHHNKEKRLRSVKVLRVKVEQISIENVALKNANMEKLKDIYYLIVIEYEDVLDFLYFDIEGLQLGKKSLKNKFYVIWIYYGYTK